MHTHIHILGLYYTKDGMKSGGSKAVPGTERTCWGPDTLLRVSPLLNGFIRLDELIHLIVTTCP